MWKGGVRVGDVMGVLNEGLWGCEEEGMDILQPIWSCLCIT